MSSRTSTRLTAALLTSGIVIAWAGAAYAVECKADADCPSGYECEKGVSMPGCAPGQDCSDAGPIVEETGFCEKAPIVCQTDADCPQFTKCVAGPSDTPCWIDSSGDSGCGEPDPNPQKTCEYVPIACAADGDCPDSFACTEVSTCTETACPAGAECPEVPPDCQTSKYCAPKEIACQVDTECPKDWTCIQFLEPCTVEASPGSEPVPCENELGKKLCTPPGFSGMGGYEKSEAASDSSGTSNTQSTAVPDDSEGGCQLAAGPASSGIAGAWLLAAASLISIRRRRSR